MNKSFTLEEIVFTMQELIAEETRLNVEKINPEMHFSSFGLDSINSIYVLDQLENTFKVKLNPLMFYDHPTIASFARHVEPLINR